MNTIVVLLLAFAVAHGEFFTYDDCDPQCISRAVSCIIEETSKKNIFSLRMFRIRNRL